MNDQVKPVKIRGTIYWACLDKKNALSDAYQVDIGQLSDAAVAALESLGIEAKHKDTQGFYITCKSSTPLMPTTAARTLLPVWLVTALKPKQLLVVSSGSSRTRKGLVRLSSPW